MESDPMSAQSHPPPWEATLAERLPLFGHRNWIVVADSAYPAQSGAGIETILAHSPQLEVVAQVLSAIAAASHVQPVVYIDRELDFIAEQDAPGIGVYRGALRKLLHGLDLHPAPHEEIIARLDRVAQAFHVLIVKTPLTLPYTSVFFELDCAYWSTAAENRLRASLSAN
jgi:hypothetical protein